MKNHEWLMAYIDIRMAGFSRDSATRMLVPYEDMVSDNASMQSKPPKPDDGFEDWYGRAIRDETSWFYGGGRNKAEMHRMWTDAQKAKA